MTVNPRTVEGHTLPAYDDKTFWSSSIMLEILRNAPEGKKRPRDPRVHAA